MDGFRGRAEAVKSQKRLSQVGKSASHMPPHMASHASPHMPPHMPPHMGRKEFFKVQHSIYIYIYIYIYRLYIYTMLHLKKILPKQIFLTWPHMASHALTWRACEAHFWASVLDHV